MIRILFSILILLISININAQIFSKSPEKIFDIRPILELEGGYILDSPYKNSAIFSLLAIFPNRIDEVELSFIVGCKYYGGVLGIAAGGKGSIYFTKRLYSGLDLLLLTVTSTNSQFETQVQYSLHIGYEIKYFSEKSNLKIEIKSQVNPIDKASGYTLALLYTLGNDRNKLHIPKIKNAAPN